MGEGKEETVPVYKCLICFQSQPQILIYRLCRHSLQEEHVVLGQHKSFFQLS